MTRRLDLMRGNALPPLDESWDWPVAPFGEAAPDRETVHRIQQLNALVGSGVTVGQELSVPLD